MLSVRDASSAPDASNPAKIVVPPREGCGDPRDVRGLPHDMRGHPHTLRSFPRTHGGFPRDPRGTPRTVRGRPRAAGGMAATDAGRAAYTLRYSSGDHANTTTGVNFTMRFDPYPKTEPDFDGMLNTLAKEAARLADVCEVITSLCLGTDDAGGTHPFRWIAPTTLAVIERALVMEALRIASILCDPAEERSGKQNCSLERLLRASGIDRTVYPGSVVHRDFEEFRALFEQLKPTRNKVVAHLDLESLRNHEIHKHFGVDLIQLLMLSSTALCLIECIAANTGRPSFSHTAESITREAQTLRRLVVHAKGTESSLSSTDPENTPALKTRADTALDSKSTH